MEVTPLVCLRRHQVSTRSARISLAFAASWLGIAMSGGVSGIAFADTRSTPLQIQIPSIPASNPKVNVVDNDLSVKLLDAQVPPVSQSAASSAGSASSSSGQVVVGQAPVAPVRHTNKKTIKPSVVMSSGTTPLAQQPFVSPLQAPQVAQPHMVPMVATTGSAASGSKPVFTAPAQYLPVAPPSRVTAVMPEINAQASAPVPPTIANSSPMDAAMQASAQLLAQAAMQASAQMLAQAAAQASAQMLSQAGLQAEQQAQQQAQVQAEQRAQAQLLAQQQAQEQARLQAELQAKLEAEKQAQLLAQQQAEEQARLQAEQQAKLEAERQALLLAQQQAKEKAELLARQQAEQQARAEAAAQAQLLAKQEAEKQAELLAKQHAEQQAQLMAKQQVTWQAQGGQRVEIAQQVHDVQPQLAAQQQPVTSAPANVLPAPQVLTKNHLQAPPAPQEGVLDQFIARLPTLSEAKQSFAASEANVVGSNDVQTQMASADTAPQLSNEEASMLAAIEPAAGNEQSYVPVDEPEPQANEVAPLPAVAGEDLAVLDGEQISHPAVKQAVQQVLSEETKRMLSAVPSAIDSPKDSKKQRVDIERDNLDNSVFSEIGEDYDPSAATDTVGMAIDVKRPTIDMNYELERAYNAIASGQTEIARESYMRVLTAEPNNIQALFGMGALLHRAGDLNGARLYYGKVLEQNPDHRDTLNNFLSLVAEEAPEEALAKLKALESKNPDFSPIPAQISYIYQRLKNMQLAAQYMIKALSLSPNNLTYKYNLAILLDRQGARQDAASFYQDLVDAHLRGESIPGNIASIQERLTFIRSNR